MIASQKIGKSFMGALRYNLKKLNHPDLKKRAELLDTNFLNLDIEQIRREVELVKALRPGLSKYVYHTSLNFHENDKPDYASLLKIAHEYLNAMGFGNNQYFIFRHHDASHPHLHLLVNRITFDGKVVSDANNYKRSERTLRDIERRYNLLQVSPSENSRVHAPTKDELELVMRNGKPSNKMLLQAKMKEVINGSRTISELIQNGEKTGISFLFNQQSTGRISGITYFFDGFKIKGQHLGNQFKWAELIKYIDYEQTRDSKEISRANSRTKTTYGSLSESAGRQSNGNRFDGIHKGHSPDLRHDIEEQQGIGQNLETGIPAKENAVVGDDSLRSDNFDYDHFDLQIEIGDDVDDEKVYGKRRRRGNDYGHSR